jgi:hypothetical protein
MIRENPVSVYENGGYMSDKWMNTKEYFVTYSILINAAKHHGFATYQEIAQANGWPLAGSYMGKLIGEIVGLISKTEVENGRPMMSAIVVGVSGKPGEGFFNWARELGLLIGDQDEEEFWYSECEKIYEEWKIPYRKENF